MQLALSPLAAADIQEILQYTLEQGGEEQQFTYAALLNQALARLKDNPHLGRHREDIIANYRAYKVEKHIIFYTIRQDVLFVARILHGKMDAKRHIQAD